MARRYVPYSYIYATIETGAGILVIAGLATWMMTPLTLIVSTIGAVSAFKAVYMESGKAGPQVRMRRQRQRNAAGFHFSDREPDDDGDLDDVRALCDVRERIRRNCDLSQRSADAAPSGMSALYPD